MPIWPSGTFTVPNPPDTVEIVNKKMDEMITRKYYIECISYSNFESTQIYELNRNDTEPPNSGHFWQEYFSRKIPNYIVHRTMLATYSFNKKRHQQQLRNPTCTLQLHKSF